MSKEHPYRDQAERLRQRIERIHEGSSKAEELPPRSNVHSERKKKMKWKVKYPVIRLLVLFFILLPLTIFSAISYLEEKKDKGSQEVNGDISGYEQIKYKEDNTDENNDNSEKTKINEEAAGETEEQKDQPEISGDETRLNTPVKPPAVPKSTTAQKKTDKNVKSGNIIYHKVQAKETLFRIAMKYYQSANGIEIIKKDNGITGNEIQTGQVLKIRSNSK